MNNRDKRPLLILGLTIVLLSGCSAIRLGHDTTYCQENGCNYEDAGICGNSYDIYKNYKDAQYEAYKNFPKGKSF